nr:RNA-directed DNA polymerase, eukaryota, reverse transcriptase zinc-binding domain protein [Tanacetum cinerariifolium]
MIGAKKEWGLSPKAKVRALHTAQLDVTETNGIVMSMEGNDVKGWNEDEVSMYVLHMARKSVLLKMETRNNNVKMFETFIYSSNGGLERKELWKDLEIYKRRIRNEPWVLSRDLNVTLNPSEHSAGGENKPVEQIKDMETLFHHKLNNKEAEYIREINDEEVKNAMFQIDDNKAPGPDGEDFKGDQLNTDCFGSQGSLTPLKVSDFRPIACYNVIYTCISKILTERIKGCLDKLFLEETLKGFDFHPRMVDWIMRLMLVASVLESIHVYWTSVFLLPVRVIKDINKLLKNFLWNQNDDGWTDKFPILLKMQKFNLDLQTIDKIIWRRGD